MRKKTVNESDKIHIDQSGKVEQTNADTIFSVLHIIASTASGMPFLLEQKQKDNCRKFSGGMDNRETMCYLSFVLACIC